jgi:hypothetical protein
VTDIDPRPMVDYLSQRKIQTLFSLYRYFEWADDMRRLYLELLFKSLGQLRSAVSVEEAVEVVRRDPTIGRLVITNLYAFPYMSYYYGGMYVVIEAWQKRKLYADPDIDSLLRSPFVDALREYRNASFHFSTEYFDSRMQAFVKELATEVWLGDLHAAFTRWFRFHLKLKPHEGPGRTTVERERKGR